MSESGNMEPAKEQDKPVEQIEPPKKGANLSERQRTFIFVQIIIQSVKKGLDLDDPDLISRDLMKAIRNACLAKGAQVGFVKKLSSHTINGIWNRYLDSGVISRKEGRGGARPKFRKEIEEALNKSDRSIRAAARILSPNIHVSTSTIHRVAHELKKKSRRPKKANPDGEKSASSETSSH